MVLHRQHSADGTRWATIRRLKSGRLCMTLSAAGPDPTPMVSGDAAEFGAMLKRVAQWCQA